MGDAAFDVKAIEPLVDIDRSRESFDDRGRLLGETSFPELVRHTITLS
jgi:hypothetical protein